MHFRSNMVTVIIIVTVTSIDIIAAPSGRRADGVAIKQVRHQEIVGVEATSTAAGGESDPLLG